MTLFSHIQALISHGSNLDKMATTNGQPPGNGPVTLPIINISDPTPEVGRQMIDAAAKYGFLYIDTRGTDFTPEVVERQFELVSPSQALSQQLSVR